MRQIFLLFVLILFTACGKDTQLHLNQNAFQSAPLNNSSTHPSFGAEKTSSIDELEKFIELLNEHRIKKGLRPLLHDQELINIALEHSQNMANGKVPFGHDGFKERCKKAREVLGGGNMCGENVAWGQRSAEEVFKAWLNSPPHRQTIEEPRYTHTGLSLMSNAKGSIYWTNVFLER